MTDRKCCRICHFHDGRSVCLIAKHVAEREAGAEHDPLESFWCCRFMASTATIRQELKEMATGEES